MSEDNGGFFFWGKCPGALILEASNARRWRKQRDTAKFLADHIANVSCTIDGEAIQNIAGYRVASAQFPFTAPTPWIFGDTGGAGTAVADGYFVILKPLAKGKHTIRIQGSFHFSVAEGDPFDFDAVADVTYRITVRENGHGHH